MRKMLFALAAALAVSSTAMAADMPVRKAPLAAEPASADWTGFAVGIVGGGGWATAKPDFGLLGPTIDALGGFDGKMNGWVVGGYAGYNWQVSSLVLGVEGDYTQADLNNTQ